MMRVSGEYDYRNMIEFPKAILQATQESGIDRVLINGLGVKAEELPVIERFFMAEKAAEMFRQEIKLAIVWHPQLIDGFMEAVAQNRAGLMRLFGTEEEALAWLLDNREKPGPLFPSL